MLDGVFPCRNDEISFSHSPECCWIELSEKFFAKLLGGYASLHSCSWTPAQLLCVLVGGRPEQITLKNEEREALWKQLLALRYIVYGVVWRE